MRWWSCEGSPRRLSTTWREVGAPAFPMREQFRVTLEAGGGEGWPQEPTPPLVGATRRGELPRTCDRRCGARRSSDDATRGDRHSGLHARWNQGDGEDAPPGRGAGDRGGDRARQHLPPALPPWRGRRRATRGTPRLLRLGRSDPHRLGRLPGVLAPRHDHVVRRGRCDLPLRLRRVGGPIHAGKRRRDPASARSGHRDVPRRVLAGGRLARGARAGVARHDPLGGASGRRTRGLPAS